VPSATSSDPAAFAGLGPSGDLLARILDGGRLAPAYLFDGPDATVPREAARTFAAALVCTGERRPCRACTACRRAASGNHPDVHVQGRDKATVISVEALAALLERAHASPMEAGRQVFLVEPADAMAPEAVARYLKTLEEPPPTTTFVLVTTRPDRLPDTVRSRCQRLRFPAPSEAEIAERLASEGVAPERARRLARWAGGSTTRARRLVALDVDLVVDALVESALGRPCTAATTSESVLAALRQRAGATAPDDAEPGGGAEREGGAGEALRRALDDVFHALQVVVLDRLAGVAAGPLAGLSEERAAAALDRLARLAANVRRNVSPAALLIDAVASLRGPGARRPP
jgi:DNA polymerase III delta' subunit